jgi:ACT domain-containing protein
MSSNERVVITVMGQDRVGIVAGISSVLAEHGVNIIDLTSTEMRGLFVMILLVDMSQATISLETLQAALTTKAQELNLQVIAQHEDVFRYMHRI